MSLILEIPAKIIISTRSIILSRGLRKIFI
jgi:hypothetical protein